MKNKIPSLGRGLRGKPVSQKMHQAFYDRFVEIMKPKLKECDERARRSEAEFYSGGRFR